MRSVKCKICSKIFFVKPFAIKKGWGIYCSSKCHYSDRAGKYFKCFICGNEVYRVSSKINHSKSKKYFCSKSCQTKWRNTQFFGKLHKNWRNGRSEYRSILKRNGIIQFCGRCGENDVRVLVTHHVDGNHFNNNLGNLIWLCHNCHYLAHRVKVK